MAEKVNPKTDAMRAAREARYAQAHEKPVKKAAAKKPGKSIPAKPRPTDQP